MLEDRIIVQDRGIDAGLAALMQNANKGMDPAALMAVMNNNGGFGGNGGWWWIWIILIWFCWGGNGFGGRNAGALASELNTDANTNLLMQAINGNKDAISNLSTTLNCDINAVQSALNQINAGVSQISCDTKLSSCEVINAITSGNANLASQLANCCCTTQRSIDAVNNNITKMGYENQLSVCNQTNNLVNTMNSNTLSLRDSNTANTHIMTFDQLNQGDNVYIIEVVGTFKKTTEYNVGTVISVSNAYDEPLQPGQFQLPNQPRKKLIDVTIQCNGEQKKFSIPENRTVITDNNLGLTISTDKQEIVGIIRNQYNTYKARKESIAKCDEEMSKCQALLEKLDIPKEPINTEDPRIKELQDEINELKNIIKQASSMVPPPMKQMLPQNMQNVMKEVDQ